MKKGTIIRSEAVEKQKTGNRLLIATEENLQQRLLPLLARIKRVNRYLSSYSQKYKN